MAEQSHTPGPWGELETERSVELELPDGRKISGWQDVGTADGHVVAIVVSKDAETYRDGDGVADANARLIAAAPELLEAARKALSVAESHIHDQLDGTSSLEGALSELAPVRAAIKKATGGQT